MMFLSLELLVIAVLTLQVSLQHKPEGEVKCDCIKAVRCKSWVSAVNTGGYLDLPVCGYDKRSYAPLLCCPQNGTKWLNKPNRTKREVQSLEGLKNIRLTCSIGSQLSPAEKARQKCVEYSKAIFQSVYEVSVGGSVFRPEEVDSCASKDLDDDEEKDTAQPREFPHMALIGYQKKGEDIKWLCAGSLISERFILSTAHCSNPRRPGPAMWAKLGDFDVTSDTDVARPKIYKIFERIEHPEYNQPRYHNDIALFKLEKDVSFTIYIRPACLYTKRDTPDTQADATGWGRKNYGGESSAILKKIKMEIVSNHECNDHYANISSVSDYGITLTDSMICSKEKDIGGHAVCQGDSGGPLQILLEKPYCMFGIVGITAFGSKCGRDNPGISTRVSYFIPWIVENVWPEEE